VNKRNLAAAAAAALALLTGCASAAPGQQANQAARSTKARNIRNPARDTAQRSQVTTTTTTGHSAPAGPGALPGAAVPWRLVGPAWALAQYSASTGGVGVPVRQGPTTIYLVGPDGKRYDLASWPAGQRQSWQLIAWSDTARTALFNSRKSFYQLQLTTGQTNRISLPGKNLSALSYTRPDGVNILAVRQLPDFANNGTVERFNLAGKLQQVIASGAGYDSAAYDSAGSLLAIGGKRGIELASNTGGIIRKLPVPGKQDGCTVIRWWTASTVLAGCFSEGRPQRLWLVPVSGASPAPLTPQRRNGGFDFGDFSAWQLTSGLYVNGFGACGSLVIGRQPRHGAEQEINVPGSGDNRIITATRSRLLVQRIVSCEPHNSLVWFNPSTRALTVALPARHHQFGVQVALPGFIQGKY
jgi:hypothetical protein